MYICMCIIPVKKSKNNSNQNFGADFCTIFPLILSQFGIFASFFEVMRRFGRCRRQPVARMPTFYEVWCVYMYICMYISNFYLLSLYLILAVAPGWLAFKISDILYFWMNQTLTYFDSGPTLVSSRSLIGEIYLTLANESPTLVSNRSLIGEICLTLLWPIRAQRSQVKSSTDRHHTA